MEPLVALVVAVVAVVLVAPVLAVIALARTQRLTRELRDVRDDLDVLRARVEGWGWVPAAPGPPPVPVQPPVREAARATPSLGRASSRAAAGWTCDRLRMVMARSMC